MINCGSESSEIWPLNRFTSVTHRLKSAKKSKKENLKNLVCSNK